MERLRWWLLAGAVALAAVLAITIGAGRWRAARLWQELERASGGKLERETDGFTWSQSVGGRTAVTLHAAKAIEHAKGQWTLHDVVITTYGRVEGHADRLYGDEFEYNSDTGVARAVGDVHMDLEAPQALAASHRATPDMPDADSAVHVETRGLVYVRKLGVAATDEVVHIRYGELHAESRGAEFDLTAHTLHLLRDVKADGPVRGRAVELTAARADFDRDANVLRLNAPVMTSEGDRFQAQDATVQMRRDSSVERLDAAGDVVVSEHNGALERSVAASALKASFNADSKPQFAAWSGDVEVRSHAAASTAGLRTQALLVQFDAAGQPAQADATGGVSGEQTDTRGAVRRLSGKTMTVAFDTHASQHRVGLRRVHLEGNADVTEQLPAQARRINSQDVWPQTSEMRGAALDAVFDAGRDAALKTVDGTGGVAWKQLRAAGGERSGSGRSMQATCIAHAGNEAQLDSVAMDGDVALRSVPAAARSVAATKTSAAAASKHATSPAYAQAAHLDYVAATETATLTGGARLESGSGQVAADRVVLNTASGDAQATGAVVAALLPVSAAPLPASSTATADQATHISADRAELDRTAMMATFHAGARPVRLWHAGSQMEAATVVLNDRTRTLEAMSEPRGLVHAAFVQARATGTGAKKSAGLRSVSLAAESLVYNDATRTASFRGRVTAEAADGVAHGDAGDATFAAAARQAGDPGPRNADPVAMLGSGALERLVLRGDVRVEQPGRSATGTQLVYTAADGTFLLTGSPGMPPRADSAGQGTVTGASLLLRPGDAAVVVTGGAGHRARTVIEENELKH